MQTGNRALSSRGSSAKVAGGLALCLLLAVGAAAETRTIVLGGEDGLAWRDGGGSIQAVFQTGAREIEQGNTPGGVIAFDPEGRTGWIFAQRVDETRNIAEGMLDRGGSVSSPTVLEAGIEEQLALMIDGDGETALDRKESTVVMGMVMDFDLGAPFGVNAIQFFPRNAHPDFPAPDFRFQDDFLRSYELFFNDGSPETQVEGRPLLSSFKLNLQNDQPVVDLRLPPQYVRHIRLQARTPVGFEIAEFRIFGTGFVPSAQYLSNIFDLGEDLALWGRIRWVQESLGAEGFSRVQIRTRSGLDDNPLVFNRRFFWEGAQIEVPWEKGAVVSSEGSEVNLDDLAPEEAFGIFGRLPLEERNLVSLDLADYLKLGGGEKGTIQDDLDGWSTWSSPYDLAGMEITPENIGDDELGAPIVSPGPRRYFQFKIDFFSEDLEAGTGIGPLAVTVATPPAARQILGEVFPRSVKLGMPETFTYAVMPTEMRPGVDRGFDELEIRTPVRVDAVEEIEVTFPDGRTESADFSAADLGALPLTDGAGRFAIEAVEERRFKIRFPAITQSDLEQGKTSLLKIRFRCRVLRYGTKFSGFAGSSSEGGVSQELVAGNVAVLDELDDDRVPVGTATPRGLAVDVPLAGSGGALLINVSAAPRPFTPNGDGINDVSHIRFDLSRLIDAAPVEVKIFDLAGRAVRQLFTGEQGGGSFAVSWDGKDDGGERLPPGIYLCHVSLDSDTRNEEAVRVIELVY